MEKPAVLLISSEPFLLVEAEREMRDRLILPEERDLNYLQLYGWEARLADVLQFLQTMPFLGNRRLLVIREIHKFEEWKSLLGYLEDPNPASSLLMTSSELKKSNAQFKSLSSNCEASELRRPYGKALTGWVRNRFSSAGKSIDQELVEVLIQIIGDDLGILSTEIEKIVLSSGNRDAISRDDLSVSVPGGVEIIFNLLDALGDGNGARALASLKTLLMSDSPPEYIVHMMAWHYRQLLRGKELTTAGLSPGDAAVKMGKRYSGLKEKFARQIRRASQKNIVKALEVLSECDRELKRGQISSEVLLDRLVLELLV